MPTGLAETPAPTRRATRCAWCDADLGDGPGRLPGRAVCPRCGCATTDPRPSAEELQAAYGEWYRPREGRRFSAFGDALLDRTRAQLAGRVDEIAPPGPVLDVGAGNGVLLDALRVRGRDVLGLEPDPRHPDIRDRDISQVEGEWSAVVFWHSLEHLPEPGQAIREAARLLPRGGALVIAVPNLASLQARVFGDRWLHLDIPRHLVHLRAGALQEGLRRAGFEVERVSRVRGGQIAIGWLDGLVGSLPGGLRLYQSLRADSARSAPIPAARRLAAIAAGIALLPAALACSAIEVLLGRPGTVYVEARRA